VLNLPDQRDFTDLPTVYKIAVVYAILAMLIIPAGYVILALLVPAQLRKSKSAADPYEKTFWKLIAVERLLMIASAILFGLSFFDPHRMYFVLDGLAVMALGFGATCLADYFGRTDKKHVWRKPDWLALKHYVNQVIIDNDIILDRDPSLQSNFHVLTTSEKRQKCANGNLS